MADEANVVAEGVVAGGCCQKQVADPGCCGGGPCKEEAGVDAVAGGGKAKDLKSSVAETLAASGPVVFDRVKDHLVEEELKKRTDLVLKALVKKGELEGEIKKVKPDPKTAGFDADGKVVVAAVFTDEQVKALKGHKDQLKKLESALELALNAEKPDFNKLRECVGK